MNYPEIIYKYRDWDNPLHRTLLLYNELYFASPKDFNDPFDCRICKDFDLLDTNEKKRKYVDKLMIESYPNWNNLNKNLIDVMAEMDQRLENLSQIQKDFEALSFAEQDKHYGIACFSAVWNNILMWSHYARSHQGVCIGFYEAEMRKVVFNEGRGGLVIYNSEFPKIDPLNEDMILEMFLTTHYKSIDWKYECEYRVSKLYYPDTPFNTDRIYNFSNDVIAEVILGVNISEANKREVVRVCQEKNIPVYQARKAPKEFYITCEPV